MAETNLCPERRRSSSGPAGHATRPAGLSRRELTLECYRLPDDGVTPWGIVVAWCKYCRVWHIHGAPLRPGRRWAWRLAHCLPETGFSPGGGYYLREVGPVPEWVLRDRRRRKPQGPQSELRAERERAQLACLCVPSRPLAT